jgi:RNA polymerase sigma-70 factor (ECF subfamily)
MVTVVVMSAEAVVIVAMGVRTGWLARGAGQWEGEHDGAGEGTFDDRGRLFCAYLTDDEAEIERLRDDEDAPAGLLGPGVDAASTVWRGSLELKWPRGQSPHMRMTMRARIRAGDPEAFSTLFDQHAASVYNHAFRLTGIWSIAEDVVSLTFLEAWRLRDRVDTTAEGASLRPWLLGIATNVTRNVRRAARRYDGALARLPKADVEADFADDVAGSIDDRDRLYQVRVALTALGQPEREVLALCVWSGLDYAEAARALDVPVGTVRSRLSRARKKLNKLVNAGSLPPLGRRREPRADHGQVKGDRENAVLLAEEDPR